MYIVYGSTISFEDNSTTEFSNNNATTGGAIGSNDSSISFECNSITVFSYNNADRGGAIYSDVGSTISFEDNSTTEFSNNNASYDGGAIYSHDCNVLEQNFPNSLFSNNTSSAQGETIDSFINNNGIPSKLEFYDPAICIDDHNRKQGCGKYYINHVMLGQYISASVVNYCNYPIDAKNFRIKFNDERGNGGYTISNSSNIRICGSQGIRIIGYTPLSKPLNYSSIIQLDIEQNSMWKKISVNLTVELSPCYPGFWQYRDLEKCECYHDNDNDTIFCLGNNSTIKRGYWFGNVTDKPTVTLCPINYCNFTCCETSNGYYHLSPVRDNQCKSHRSGTACGSCTHGYTLSFDSTECVSINSCTADQTVLVIFLTVTLDIGW